MLFLVYMFFFFDFLFCLFVGVFVTFFAFVGSSIVYANFEEATGTDPTDSSCNSRNVIWGFTENL